jgi:small subunit ribosomal protein S20
LLPHHKSCKKRLIQAEQERIRNNSLKTMLRKTVKETRSKIAENTDVNIKEVYSNIDKVAGKKVISKKKAGRLKSRLTKAAARAAKADA